MVNIKFQKDVFCPYKYYHLSGRRHETINCVKSSAVHHAVLCRNTGDRTITAMRDSTSKWALDLALKMRLRFGQASIKGNDIAKKQHEQSTSVEPTRKADSCKGQKFKYIQGPGRNIKGGRGSKKQ